MPLKHLDLLEKVTQNSELGYDSNPNHYFNHHFVCLGVHDCATHTSAFYQLTSDTLIAQQWGAERGDGYFQKATPPPLLKQLLALVHLESTC